MKRKELDKTIKRLAKTKKGAIAGAILKWEYLVKARKETILGMKKGTISWTECGLCVKYQDKGCAKCPLFELEGRCLSTRVTTFKKTCAASAILESAPSTANLHKWREAGRKMLKVLKTLQ